MRRYNILVGNNSYTIDVKEVDAKTFRVRVRGQEYIVTLDAEEDVAESVIRPEILPEKSALPQPYRPPDPATLRQLPPQVSKTQARSPETAPGEEVSSVLRAPMPGTILSVEVTSGTQVERGQPLLIMEAMKMKNPIRAPRPGIIKEVLVSSGQSVHFDDPLLTLEEAS